MGLRFWALGLGLRLQYAAVCDAVPFSLAGARSLSYMYMLMFVLCLSPSFCLLDFRFHSLSIVLPLFVVFLSLSLSLSLRFCQHCLFILFSSLSHTFSCFLSLSLSLSLSVCLSPTMNFRMNFVPAPTYLYSHNSLESPFNAASHSRELLPACHPLSGSLSMISLFVFNLSFGDNLGRFNW